MKTGMPGPAPPAWARAALSCCGTLPRDRCVLRSHHSGEHIQAARPRPRKAVKQGCSHRLAQSDAC